MALLAAAAMWQAIVANQQRHEAIAQRGVAEREIATTTAVEPQEGIDVISREANHRGPESEDDRGSRARRSRASARSGVVAPSGLRLEPPAPQPLQWECRDAPRHRIDAQGADLRQLRAARATVERRGANGRRLPGRDTSWPSAPTADWSRPGIEGIWSFATRTTDASGRGLTRTHRVGGHLFHASSRPRRGTTAMKRRLRSISPAGGGSLPRRDRARRPAERQHELSFSHDGPGRNRRPYRARDQHVVTNSQCLPRHDTRDEP